MVLWKSGGDFIYRNAVISQSPESRSALWVSVILRAFYAEVIM